MTGGWFVGSRRAQRDVREEFRRPHFPVLDNFKVTGFQIRDLSTLSICNHGVDLNKIGFDLDYFFVAWFGGRGRGRSGLTRIGFGWRLVSLGASCRQDHGEED